MRISDWSSDVCSSDLNEASANPSATPALRNGSAPSIRARASCHGGGESAIESDNIGMALKVYSAVRPVCGLCHCPITALHGCHRRRDFARSEEHTSELQSLMRISYAVFCLKQKQKHHTT